MNNKYKYFDENRGWFDVTIQYSHYADGSLAVDLSAYIDGKYVNYLCVTRYLIPESSMCEKNCALVGFEISPYLKEFLKVNNIAEPTGRKAHCLYDFYEYKFMNIN